MCRAFGFLRQDPYQPQTATVVGYSGDAAFKDWKFDSVIFEDRYVPYGMFECPDLFELPGGVSWSLISMGFRAFGCFQVFLSSRQTFMTFAATSVASFIRNPTPCYNLFCKPYHTPYTHVKPKGLLSPII